MESKGIIYVATGKKFVDEALISARSAKKQMPDIPICLFTDVQELAASPPDSVDSVRLLADVTHSCRDKMKPMADSPYEKTLFLDTDTYICDRIDELFDILDKYDIAAAHSPYRIQYHLSNVPDCFPEANTGVIVFKKNDISLDVLHRWPGEYLRQIESECKPHHDQHSFRAVLYYSTARYLVLPNEYNFRSIGPNFAGKGCKVKIIHGRHADLELVAERLNQTQQARVFLTSPYRIFSQDIGTYESMTEAAMNALFQGLPKGLKNWLSILRHRHRLSH